MLARANPYERRFAPRFACRKPSIIQITRADRIACTVLDISAGGALIGLMTALVLPRQFELLIAEDLFQADCEVRHQNGLRAGVMFTSRLAEAFARYRDPPFPR